MKKIAIIGLYKGGKQSYDGQTIKTVIFTEEIKKKYGSETVDCIDTFEWKKHPQKLFFESVKAVMNSQNVLFFTDAGGIKVFPWLLTMANIKKKCKIHYVVIGGWLPEFLKANSFIRYFAKKIDYIYVETSTMKKAIDELGFDNVHIVPNCKRLDILTPDELVYSNTEPYKLCTFSRVMREKGIEDAVNAVKKINEESGRTVYELDIYGQVDSEQTDWFDELKKTFPDYVRYKGCADFDKSVEILKDYFVLLFPTKFYTEGIPGTIIDAYAAGVPVVSSEWESFDDVLEKNIVGFGYAFGETNGILKALSELKDNPEKANRLKENCLKKAEKFKPENVMEYLYSRIS